MSAVKVLPHDIKEIEQKAGFKGVSAKHTVEQLESKLRADGVAFLSADIKRDLVWRYMDARGLDFDTGEAVTQADTLASNEEPIDAPVADALVQESTPKPEDAPTEVEAPEVPADATETTEAATNEGINDDKSAIGTDAPLDTAPANESSDNVSNDTKKPADKPTETPAPIVEEKPADDKHTSQPAPALPKSDSVTIEHTGDFNFLESATQTLVYAGKTTTVKTTPRVSREQILRNIKQYNQTRGNVLKVT